jgi:glycosyltransferase involved in cell wall biosynthesis
MNNLVSIIVPIYNSELYLERCISSIINQTYKDIEIILVNDGSNDNSKYICEKYMKIDSRIFLINKENNGQSSARNDGLDFSKGSFLAFIDSDDYIDKNYILNLYNNLVTFDCDVSICSFISFDKNYFDFQNGYLSNFNNYPQGEIFFKEDFMLKLTYNKQINFSPWGKLYKREVIGNIRFRPNEIYEDIEFTFKTFHNSNKISFDYRPFYFYYINTLGTIYSDFNLKKLDEFKAKERLLNFYMVNYPNFVGNVIIDLFFTGIRLFLNVSLLQKKFSYDYLYLVKIDKFILNKYIFSSNTSFFRKVFYIFFRINNNLSLYFVYIIRRLKK